MMMIVIITIIILSVVWLDHDPPQSFKYFKSHSHKMTTSRQLAATKLPLSVISISPVYIATHSMFEKRL